MAALNAFQSGGVSLIKTSKKSAAKTPDLVPQEHGGALLSGGVPGNKGGTGRPPDEFKQWLAETLNRPGFRKSFEEKMDAADPKAADFAAEFTTQKPAQQHKVDATVLFKAVRE